MASETFGPAVTLILGLATVAFTLNTIRRTDFERARQLHAELTTGPVAKARHVVGSAMENPARTRNPELDEAEIEALFIVLWCFERIDVASGTLLGRWHYLPNWFNPRRALYDSIRIHVQFYYDYVHRASVNGTPLRNSLTATEDDAGLLRLARRLHLAPLSATANGNGSMESVE